MTDLAGERAASAARKAGEITEARARYLRDNAIRMRLPLTEESLAESARATWAHLPEETTDAVVARALEMAPAAAERREETMAQSERVRILREGIREELAKDPGLSAAGIAERLEYRGIRVPPTNTFAPYCSVARKELGIQGASGGRPAKNGKRPKVAKPKQAAAAPPRVEELHPSPAEDVPTTPAEEAPPAVAAEPERDETAPTPTVEAAPAPRCSHRAVEFSSDSDHFRAWRQEDGSWDVELSATLDEEQMGQLAEVLWRHVVGRPRRSAA